MESFDLSGERTIPDAMQFSPNNRHLAIQAFGRVDVLDTTTGALQPVSPEYPGKVGTAGVGFTADGRSVVYFKNDDYSVHTFNLETKHDQVLRHSKQVPWRPSGDASISTMQPDGRLAFVAASPQERTVEVVALDPSTGEQKLSFARHRSYIRELAVSPDGQWVAGCSTIDLRVWYIGGHKLPNRASWHVQDRKQSCFGNLALSRDGA